MTAKDIWKPGNLIQWQGTKGNSLFLILEVYPLEQWGVGTPDPLAITVLYESGQKAVLHYDRHMRNNPYFKLIYDATEE